MSDSFIERKIYYHHTDAGGVVYYATYLHLLEEARVEFLKENGLDMKALMDRGIVFPVVHVEADYKSPAKYGDRVRIFTKIEKIGSASIIFIQEIKRDEALLVVAKTVWACTGVDFKVRRVPDDFKEVFKKNNG